MTSKNKAHIDSGMSKNVFSKRMMNLVTFNKISSVNVK